MARTRTVRGRTQYHWNGNWHTVPEPVRPGSLQGPGFGVAFSQAPSIPGLAPQSSQSSQAPGPGDPGYTPPPDPTLEAQRANLTTAYNNANSQITYDEGRIKQDYGFDDVSNPFSRAALLQRSFQERQRGTTNTLAARGQLYSGAMQNQRAIDQRGYDQAYDSTKRQYGDLLQGIISRRKDADLAYQSGNLDALSESTNRQLQKEPDPITLDSSTAAQAGTPAPSGGSPAAQRRAKRRKLGITDVRNLTPAQIRRLRERGLLPS